MKTFFLGFIFCLLNSALLLAQDLTNISENFLLFEEVESGEPYLVINDSVLIKNLNFDNPTYIKFPEGLKLKDFNRYQYSVNGKNYFVENGNGPVLIFENDSFKRIDKTYSYRSQFGAVPFAYNNHLFLWAGYGELTGKKILTQYDWNTKTWILHHTKNHETIKKRFRPIYFPSKDQIYIFSGHGFSDNNSRHSQLEEDQMHILDLPTMTWQLGPQIKPKYIKELSTNEYGHLLFFDNFLVGFGKEGVEDIYRINPVTGHVDIYSNHAIMPVAKAVYCKNHNEVTFVRNDEKAGFQIGKYPLEIFLDQKIATDTLYKDTFNWTILRKGLLLVAIFGLGFILLFKFYLRKKHTLSSPFFIYDLKKDQYFYKGKVLDDITFNRKKVLNLFFYNNNQPVDLSKINDLLTINDNDSYATIIKRRDNVISELKTKLSSYLDLPEEKVFVEMKNPKDRRIKLIKLNIETKLINSHS